MIIITTQLVTYIDSGNSKAFLSQQLKLHTISISHVFIHIVIDRVVRLLRWILLFLLIIPRECTLRAHVGMSQLFVFSRTNMTLCRYVSLQMLIKLTLYTWMTRWWWSYTNFTPDTSICSSEWRCFQKYSQTTTIELTYMTPILDRYALGIVWG